jgi:hypothetical protein
MLVLCSFMKVKTRQVMCQPVACLPVCTCMPKHICQSSLFHQLVLGDDKGLFTVQQPSGEASRLERSCGSCHMQDPPLGQPAVALEFTFRHPGGLALPQPGCLLTLYTAPPHPAFQGPSSPQHCHHGQ